ncbi:MAG: undecaprenyl-diphosphate phosphatase [Holosporales bacterium]
MSLFQVFVLAVIQGLTEFLPISSSGHLILVPLLLGWPDQGLLMDVAVHVGTLGAVLVYFYRDVWSMIRGFVQLCGGKLTAGGKMALLLIVSTLPAVAFGYWLSQSHLGELRSMTLIAWTSIGYGLLLYAVDKLFPQAATIKDLNGLKALFIGFGQALALIPGTSRSGACMTFGRMLGLTRTEAARYAFLMSIPSIIAAATLTGFKAVKAGTPLLSKPLLWGMGFAFLSGLAAIRFMMTWLRTSDFKPFMIYRVVLGGFLLFWAHKGPSSMQWIAQILASFR